MKHVTNVLLVEDNAGDARLLEEMLSEGGANGDFFLTNARSFAEAATAVAKQVPDAVLLDLSLPDCSGIDTVRRMGAAVPGVPIVVLTGLDDEALGLEALRCGAQDYLIKGRSDGKTLIRAIRYAVQRKGMEEALRRAKDELEIRVRERTEELATLVETLQAEVRQRRQAEESLTESESRYRQLFQSAPVGLCTLSAEGTILAANERLQQITGYSEEELVGRRMLCLCSQPQEHEAFLQKMMQPQGVQDWEMHCSRKDGKAFAALINGDPIGIGGFRVGLASVRDISDQKYMEKQVMEAAQREQRRIGQDLHDTIQQNLAGIAFMAKALERKLTRQDVRPAEHAPEAGNIAGMIEQIIGQTRSVARSLTPVEIQAGGLLDGLRHLAANTREMFGIDCDVECDGHVVLSDEAAATQLYYICQEALQNAVKHGRPTRIRLGLEGGDQQLRLTVSDNGRGLASTPAGHTGIGLRTMRYRARLIGAHLEIRPAEGGGTVVECRLHSPSIRTGFSETDG